MHTVLRKANQRSSRQQRLGLILGLTVGFAPLLACSTEKGDAPPASSSTSEDVGTATSSGGTSNNASKSGADLTQSSKLVTLQSQLSQLNQRKTAILGQMGAVSANDAQTKESDIDAQATAAQHNTVADGFGAAGSAGAIALSIMTGGTFGAIMGGVGLASSAFKMANDASINAKAADQQAQNKKLSAAAAAQMAQLQQQLDQTNAMIGQVTNQINAAAPSKSRTASLID